MENSKDGQIIDPSGSSHSVDLGGLPRKAIKAIIERLNQKSQRATRVFKEEYDLSTNDLRQLIAKITQEFNSCSIISQVATASVVLSKNQRFDFSSWKEFEEFDTSSSQTTKSLSFGMTLDVMRGENSHPERYEVQVSVQNNPAMFGIQIGPLGIRPVEGFEIPPAPLVASVNFNNYILGKNILSTIEEWEKALKRRDSATRKFFQRWSSSIRSVLVYIATLSGIYACRLPLEQINQADQKGIGEFFLIATAVIFSFYSLGSFFAKQVESHIDRQLPHNNITLTEGDVRLAEKRRQRNTATVIKAVAYILGIGIQVLCGVAASVIWQQFGQWGIF